MHKHGIKCHWKVLKSSMLIKCLRFEFWLCYKSLIWQKEKNFTMMLILNLHIYMYRNDTLPFFCTSLISTSNHLFVCVDYIWMFSFIYRREIYERDLNRQKEQKSSKVPPSDGFSSYFTSTKENQSNKDHTAYSSKYKGTSFKTRFDFQEPSGSSW